jgi:hypothetical protein
MLLIVLALILATVVWVQAPLPCGDGAGAE